MPPQLCADVDTTISFTSDGSRGTDEQNLQESLTLSLVCRLMGFGHRVYKTYDPRAKIMKQVCDQVLEHVGIRSGHAMRK